MLTSMTNEIKRSCYFALLVYTLTTILKPYVIQLEKITKINEFFIETEKLRVFHRNLSL